jgi:hypothetical protein
LIGVAAALAAGAAGEGRLPRFEDYPVRRVFRGKPAPLRPEYRSVSEKTNIQWVAARPANFAGRYIMAVGSCGADCRSLAAIDALTGRVLWFGHSLVPIRRDRPWPKREIDYRLRSRLLILRGMRDERDADYGTHFYRLEKGRFVHIRSVPYRKGEPW